MVVKKCDIAFILYIVRKSNCASNRNFFYLKVETTFHVREQEKDRVKEMQDGAINQFVCF